VDQPSASVIDDEPDVQQLEAHRGTMQKSMAAMASL
jgi:hypothetical protein